MRADPTFRLELGICDDAGIPHSEFLLTWTPEDRGKAIAYRLEKAAACQRCGTQDWEWDPNQGGSKFAYEAVPRFCPGCYAIAAASDDTARQDGITIELHPTGTVESAKRLVAAQNRKKSRRRG